MNLWRNDYTNPGNSLWDIRGLRNVCDDAFSQYMAQLAQEWITNHEGRRQLLIPIPLLDETYHLRITPAERCSLYQEAAEELWIDMLAGLLSMQTARIMLMEIPGIAFQQQWMMTFEHGLIAKISELPMMRQSSTYFSGLAHSYTRHVHSVAMLWLTWHNPNVLWHQVDTTWSVRRIGRCVCSIRIMA